MSESDVYKVKIPFCSLEGLADCEHRIDGKMSFCMLCGGNSLNDDVKKCPYRVIYDGVFQSDIR